jgi:hypothetical protein
MVNSAGVEGGRTTPDSVDFIALLQKKLREIGTILARHAGDHCPLKRHAASPLSCLRESIPDHSHRAAFSCFLDLGLPIVSE